MPCRLTCAHASFALGKDGIARAIYVTAVNQRVVIVRAFVKKTQKTPKHELALARQRAKEVV